MRAPLSALLLCLSLAAAAPADAVQPRDVLVAEGRIPLAATAPLTAVTVSPRSIFVADEDGERVCEYTHAGNVRRCFGDFPSAGPLDVTALAWRAPEPAYRAGSLYVASSGHDRIYRVDLHSGRTEPNHLHLEARSLAVADYGLLVGRPVLPDNRVDTQAFHRLSPDLRPAWSFERVDDEILAESPWAPLAVGPDGDVYGAVAGRYQIARYGPTGRQKQTFGIPSPVFEDTVPRGRLAEKDWLELWSPIHRLDRIGDWLVVASRVHRMDRRWDVMDIYSLDGTPAVRSLALEEEEPVASSSEHLYTLRRDEPGTVLYRWKVQVPEELPSGGLVAALPPALQPVRAASATVGDVSWDMLRPYLEAAYRVVAVERSRPVVEMSEDAMATHVSGYLDPVGRSVTEALGRVVQGELGETLRRNFLRATFDGAGAEGATLRGWDQVLGDPVLKNRLRGELCRELRARGYPCP